MKASLRLVTGLLLLAGAVSAQAQYTAKFLERTKAWGTVVADFNGDGVDDFFISGHHTEDRMWYWNGKGYSPSAQMLVYVDRHDCDAADVNKDGRMDMYCAVGAAKGTAQKSNELWIQQASGEMLLATNFGAEDHTGRSRNVTFFDMNKDGWPDLYVTNEATTRPDGLPNYNHVFINQGNSTFVEKTTIATGGRGFQCVKKGDINGDGWDDLLVCNEKGPAHIYLNNKAGDFTELVSPALSGEFRDAQLVDMNGDGRLDLIALVDLGPMRVWLNSGSGSLFTTPAYEAALPYRGVSLAVTDLNRDGRKDIYVVMQDPKCTTSFTDLQADFVFWGSGATFVKEQLPQTFQGCGYRADVLDGRKVLLANGGVSWRGPNYVLQW